MKKAVIYARYSSERQTEQSIEGQLRVCNEYAKRNDITIVDTYIDRAMTGTNDNRASFQRMLLDSNFRQWEFVLVYKLDRFSRNKYEMAIHRNTLKLNKVKLVSCTENIPDSPEGVILESLLEGMAEYYSAELSQKVKRGLNESRQKGLFTGGPLPYGYKIANKRVVIDEEKANAVRHIFNRYAAGAQVPTIIEELTKAGFYNHDKPFAKTTVHRILACEKYIGISRHGDEVYTNTYPPIIDKDVFDMIQKKIANNRYGRRNENNLALLKGKVFCGKCGKPITMESGTARNGEVQRYYKCSGKKRRINTCTLKPLGKESFEKDILAVVLNVVKNETIDIIASHIVAYREKCAKDESKLRRLRTLKQEKTTALNNLVLAIEQGIITPTTKSRMNELETELNQLEELIFKEECREFRVIKYGDVVKYLRNAITKELNTIYAALIEKVIVFDKKVEIYFKYCNPKDDLDKGKYPPCSYGSTPISKCPVGLINPTFSLTCLKT